MNLNLREWGGILTNMERPTSEQQVIVYKAFGGTEVEATGGLFDARQQLGQLQGQMVLFPPTYLCTLRTTIYCLSLWDTLLRIKIEQFLRSYKYLEY